jgi:hypothetical protein
MVGVVNPTADKSLQSYVDKAKSISRSVTPPAVFGGVLGDAGSSGGDQGGSGDNGGGDKPGAAGSTNPSFAAVAALLGAAVLLL